MKVTARHYARLGIVQYLYYLDVQNCSLDDGDEQLLLDVNVIIRGDLAYFQKLLQAIPPKIPEIDELLATAMHRSVDEIDAVERAILRLGVYELIAEPDVPLKVVANECIELSREFGNPDSYRFINGTLDKLAFNSAVRLPVLMGKQDQACVGREFEIINRYFADRQANDDVRILTGIGDDCAILDGSPNRLLVTTDTLIENVHFPASTDARRIGYKALAVSLSDLASKGARPAYALLNLSLAEYDQEWLARFSRGFFDLASEYGVVLIGGDTVRGPLVVSITAFGYASVECCPLRNGARPGDVIYVTGTLGDAALGLFASRFGSSLEQQEIAHLQQCLEFPNPRVAAGQVIARHATASIDLSDGLIADLSHILNASGVGASIELSRIPLSSSYQKLLADIGWHGALAHGDDYELCFTVPEPLPATVLDEVGIPLHCIGRIHEGEGLAIVQPDGQLYPIESVGYSHF